MEEHSLFGLEEDEDEQGYVREGEELEDIYEDDELLELEGEELELVMENQMERKDWRKKQELTPYEIVMQGASKHLCQFKSVPYGSGNTG